MKESKREVSRPVRWTKEEYETMEQAAALSGTDVSSFIRISSLAKAKAIIKKESK